MTMLAFVSSGAMSFCADGRWCSVRLKHGYRFTKLLTDHGPGDA